MRTLAPIATRTFVSLFLRPTAYVVIALYALVAGGLYWGAFLSPDGAELSMRGFFERAPLLLAFFAPALTMDTLTSERRQGTLALWRALPVDTATLAGGTWLGVLGAWTVLLALTLFYPLWLSTIGPVEVGPIASGHVGLWLLGGAFLAIGVATASVTRDPIAALLSAFVICVALTASGDVARLADGALSQLLVAVSVEHRFRSFARGLIDARDVAWFAGLVVLALGAATRGLRAGRAA